ncbi:DegV family protein [Yimella sp. cx-573]|nr:DegV family protein [Yimella sp. cx-573]
MTVAVVTDSSAYLPKEIAAGARVFVVPLHVALDGVSHDEGVDISPGDVADALRVHRAVVTSRPSPGAFLEVYEELLARGVDRIVSVHLSGHMSGTVSSAEIAAAECAADIRVVDSGVIGMAMGFPVLAAAQAAADGADIDEVARVVQQQAGAARAFFYVDTLDHLRRGGRVGRASSLVGSALSIKPLLTLKDGHIEALEKVRTTSRALARMLALTVDAADAMDTEQGIDLAVQHLDARERAEQLAEQLAETVPGVRRVLVDELGAAVGAHVGPGTVSVAIVPRPESGLSDVLD